jgi:hypothetical protein
MGGAECSACGARVAPAPRPADDGGLGLVIPMNVEPCSTIAGYLGLFSLLFVFLGPFAVVFGVVGLRRVGKAPGVRGKGRAWTGIVLGALGTVLTVLIVLALLAG